MEQIINIEKFQDEFKGVLLRKEEVIPEWDEVLEQRISEAKSIKELL